MKTIEKIVALCCLFFSAILIIYLLYHYTIGSINKNGFTRTVRQDMGKLINLTDLREDGYYFAGISKDRFYLGNYRNVQKLFSSDFQLKDTQTEFLNIPDSIDWATSEISVLDGFLFIVDRTTSTLLRLNIDSLRGNNTIHPTIRFSSAWPLSSTTYVLKTFDKSLEQNILVKFPDLNSNYKFVPTRQKEGYFSIDGMLIHNYSRNLFIYVYYYQNSFVRLDSILRPISAYRSIDTVTIVKNEIVTYNTGKTKTFGNPPAFINRKSCLYKDLLFIYSDRPADNENRKESRNNFVIDVYATKNGHYQFSFYLPRFSFTEITGLCTYDNFLAISYRGNAVAVFSLNF